MVTSTIPEPLHPQVISELYLGRNCYNPMAVLKLVSWKYGLYKENDGHTLEDQKVKLEIAARKYPTYLDLGNYLAQGQMDLKVLKDAAKVTNEDMARLDIKERLQVIDGVLIDEKHPARTTENTLWNVMVAKVIKNIAINRVPVEQQTLLYFDHFALEPQAIHMIKAFKKDLKPRDWDTNAKRDLDRRIEEAKESCRKQGFVPENSEHLSRYLALGQVTLDDLNEATILTPDQAKKISHLEKVDESHRAYSDNPLNNFAAKLISDRSQSFYPPKPARLDAF